MTETVTVTRQNKNLHLGSLHTVKLLQAHPWVQDTSAFTQKRIDSARQWTIIGWIYATLQFQILWLWTLFHTLPWPSWVIDGVHRTDEKMEGVLEIIITKMEWWVDYISITFMRLMESMIVRFESVIVAIDSCINYILGKFDWVYNLAMWAFGVVQPIVAWAVSVVSSAWQLVKETVHNLHNMWTVSQESKKEQ